MKLGADAEGGGDVDAAERIAGGVEDAHAVGVVRREDDAPVAGRRRAVKLGIDAEGGGDEDAAERTPTQSALSGAKTTRPLAAVAAPRNL